MRTATLPLLCSALLLTVAARAEDKPYVIGLAPTIAESYSVPEGRILSKYLTTALGHPVESKAFDSYEQLTNALENGDVDLAWINPYSYVRAAEQSHVIPIAKTIRSGETYRAVFFVKADSKVQGLDDLKGLRVAWVTRTSTAGYLFPQSMLVKAHMDPTKLFGSEFFAGSHKAVCDAVASGGADVGATFHTGENAADMHPDGCRISLGSEAAQKLRAIASSDPIPTEVIAARSTLDRDLALKLAGVFSRMADSKEGKQVLTAVFHANAFGVPLDSDYDSVRGVAATLVGATDPAPAAATAPAGESHAAKSPGGVVHFASGSFEVISDSFPVLDEVVAKAKANGHVRLHIDGYSDSAEPALARPVFAKLRAEAVRAYFVSAGLAAERLVVAGHGDENPVSSSQTDSGHAANRRVEIRIAP